MRLRALLPALLFATCFASAALAGPARSGRLGGVVVAQGTPQLGAIVILTPQGRPGEPARLMTDRRGFFSSDALLPGAYSVRVHVAGFLPAFEPRVWVAAGQITLLRIQMGSLFSSIDRLRQGPAGSHNPGEWKWVLRSATLNRPVLRFAHGRITVGAESKHHAAPFHGRAEVTAGSVSSWSPANLQPAGSTSFVYGHDFSPASKLLLAARVGYEHATTSAMAASWVRSADGTGDPTDSTTIVLRQSDFGAAGPSFRGVEIDSRHKMPLGSRMEFEYGGQFVLAAMGVATSAVRPEAELRVRIDPGWSASLLVSSTPGTSAANPSEMLDQFATPVRSAHGLALDTPWHEEIALSRQLTARGKLSGAIFHDSDANTAIFGRGTLAGPYTIADPFSDAFVYNGGALHQWGARVGYKENLSGHWQAAVVYALSQTLAPSPSQSDLDAASLRNLIDGQSRDSVGGRVSGRLRRTGTEISAGYQWVDGPVLTRPDPFGAALYGIDPYLNVSVRQPLPNFFCCRIVAMVDVRNLLAQGYVNLDSGNGTATVMPAARAIRGGFAVQF